ncbi:MAG: hypothetical protein EOM37_08085 [Proteobacteria bacterium]|jgi:hypothetical protein|nr:hypothetical protein [Alphaproteobacteria bacterium]NCC03985.1 hypothetical protein [Pseudomonadota bacterium]
MRLFSTLFLVFALMVGCGAVSAQSESFSDIKKWANKFGFDKVDGVTLWEHPAFVQAMRETLDAAHFETFMSEWSQQVSTMLTLKGDILNTFVCKAHACNSDNVNIFIDLKQQQAYACWHQREEGEDYWFALGKARKAVGPTGCITAYPYELFDKYSKE